MYNPIYTCENRTAIAIAMSSESVIELALKDNYLPADVSEISKKYLEMSAPPLSLGGSERNQHLQINYRRLKNNALFCYQFFQGTYSFIVQYIQVENSIQTETENRVLI